MNQLVYESKLIIFSIYFTVDCGWLFFLYPIFCCVAITVH